MENKVETEEEDNLRLATQSIGGTSHRERQAGMVQLIELL